MRLSLSYKNESYFLLEKKENQDGKKGRRKGTQWNVMKLRPNKIPERYIDSQGDLSSN